MIEKRDERKGLIKEIEEIRESRLLVYFTGDRPYASSQIAEDAVRILYDHLLEIGKVKKIDLFLYSRGGDVSVPWRIVSMIREFCDEFNVIIPYKAHSAATLISLGADNIIMCRKAELSPIDPTLVRGVSGTELPPEEISVEDINSYINFIKNKAGISDQMALSQNIAILTDKIGPHVLGQIDRMDHHIRLVARKMLVSRNKRLEEEKINSIIETLTEKIYSHGHAIGRKEAKEIGLSIIEPNEKLENLFWKLYIHYENFLKLTEPISPDVLLKEKEREILENLPIAVIETTNKLHVFRTNLEIKKRREIPPNPEINVNLNLSLPPEVLESIRKEDKEKLQLFYQQILEELNRIIPSIVYENLILQSPVIGFDIRFIGGWWKNE